MTIYVITTKEGREYGIKMTTHKVGYGEKELMICPKCGKRRTKLYYDPELGKFSFLCRECLPGNFYRDITNTPKGGTRYINHKMNRLAEDMGIVIKRPFHPLDYALDKPKYMRETKWIEFLKRMAILENMRWQTLGEYSDTTRKKYDTKVIKYFMQEALNIEISFEKITTLWLDWEEMYIE